MPVHLRYQESHLALDHYFGITSVAFSSGGTLLATAGLDGKVCIWDVDTHKLLHMYKNKISIVSLAWIKNGEDSLLIGYEDGNVTTLSITPNTLNLAGFCAHDFATEIIANDGALVATAARDEVRIWEWHPLAPWQLVLALAGPPKTSANLSTEVLVVSLHWASWKEYLSVLVVCYQNHGIFVYESAGWTLVHTVPIRDPIARADLSPDGQYLALYNLAKGIEVRKLSTGALRCAFPLESGEKRLLPVAFIHGGEVLVAGTTSGDVGVWHLQTSQKIQDLHHDKQDKVLALAGHYDYDRDRFLIITATYGCKARAVLRWWTAVERMRDDQDTGGTTTYTIPFGWLMKNIFGRLNMVIVLGVAITFTLATFVYEVLPYASVL
ncbi:WD40 repeat-like protein [Lentinus brumalis]|uniref:WD40 repeat-like protein n=1 Tax=Lentinus brumalis TaxID=2498619 RepID=A0A371DEK3_9APHY|nr:WD40 repeat-like protein [Polyporus brumalis]